jgi:endonuclease G, mitochondrial
VQPIFFLTIYFSMLKLLLKCRPIALERCMKRKITFTLCLIIITSTLYFLTQLHMHHAHHAHHANNNCFEQHCPTGAPLENHLLDHGIFTLSANRTTKFSDWIAYQVDKKNIRGPKRKRRWRQDPNIPTTDTLAPKDYKGAHKACTYDRGHHAPLGSFSNHPLWENTNYLSNITPQKTQLNRGPWAKLENKVRRLANKIGTLYVVTGPLYDPSYTMCPLPEKPRVKVPNAFFKVIFKQIDGDASYAAFIMPQKSSEAKNFCQYTTSLDELKAKTKLTFLQSENKINNKLATFLGC